MRPSLHFGMCGDDQKATVQFLQDAEIRDLVCDIKQIPGREEKGMLAQDDLRAFKRPFEEAGISLSVVTVGWMTRDASGRPPEPDLATICHDIAVLGGEGVPVAQLFDGSAIPEAADPDRYLDGLYSSYRRMIGVCAEAGVKLAVHGSWLPRHALWNAASLLALFDAVPDVHNGVSFCAGSSYQSGDDVLDAVRRLASRLHFVHFRDADGIGGSCPEMLLGKGKVRFAALTKTLREVGYSGPVHCEHFGRFRCQQHDEVAVAWGAGFMRGLFQEL